MPTLIHSKKFLLNICQMTSREGQAPGLMALTYSVLEETHDK